MDSMNLTNTLIESGRHSEIDGMLAMVCDSCYEGSPRYPAAACRELERVVLTQQYGTQIFEMVNFLYSAREISRDGFAGVLWAQPVVTANSCRHMFQAQGNSITVPGSDGQFSITFSRMPFLAALTEFIVTTLGYDYLQGIVESIQVRSDFSKVANEISRSLYAHLQAFLPSLQSQRKFNALTHFLDQRYADAFAPESISDQDIFDFWVLFGVEGRIPSDSSVNAEGGKIDAKTFEGVHRDFVNLYRAIEIGITKQSIKSASSMASYDEGGIDLEKLGLNDRDVFGDELQTYYFNQLDEEPLSRLKLLGGQEKDLLRPLMEAGASAERWSRSLLRCYHFGQVQRRLTQALRRNADSAELREICDISAEDGYENLVERLNKVSQRLKTTELACLYALHRADEFELSPEASTAGTETLRSLERAYRSINRFGFEPNPEADTERIEAFRESSQPLTVISSALNNWLERVRSLSVDAYQRDAELFRTQFIRLYIGIGNETLA